MRSNNNSLIRWKVDRFGNFHCFGKQRFYVETWGITTLEKASQEKPDSILMHRNRRAAVVMNGPFVQSFYTRLSLFF